MGQQQRNIFFRIGRRNSGIADFDDAVATKRKRVVRFHADVMAKPIASHKLYSDRAKSQLWNSPQTINDNACRNWAEFETEGQEWENVLESEEMYMDATTGELIHPHWVENFDENESNNNVLFAT